ncbi:MAG TPA: TetR-like C-terminal domain-containing protein [Alphaproteobacteria bacterium]|nr:TetR-like C-terminal domain-containing protein [Alphaproteobacteria bacterium]
MRNAVFSAVLDRLKDGDSNFSFQDIAKDAGVHVATIYARWPERASLVMAAYEEHMRKLDIPSTSKWESYLHKLGIALRDFLNDPVEITANKLLITAGDTAYRDQMVRRFASVAGDLAKPLEAAKAGGRIRAEVDCVLVVYMIIAPILSLIMFTGQVPDDAYVRNIVDHLIHACRA